MLDGLISMDYIVTTKLARQVAKNDIRKVIIPVGGVGFPLKNEKPVRLGVTQSKSESTELFFKLSKVCNW